MKALSPEAYAVLEGRHPDPFHYLGPHFENDAPVVRVYLPNAEQVKAVDEHGDECELRRVHDAGLFGPLKNASRRYRVRARFGESTAGPGMDVCSACRKSRFAALPPIVLQDYF